MIKQILSSIVAKNKALLLHEASKTNDFMRLLMKHRNTRIYMDKGRKENIAGAPVASFLLHPCALSFFASPVAPSCFLCLLKYSIEERTDGLPRNKIQRRNRIITVWPLNPEIDHTVSRKKTFIMFLDIVIFHPIEYYKSRNCKG